MEESLKIRWQRATDARYYEVYLGKDLFSSWVVTQVWGRRGGRLGRVRHIAVESYQAGLALVERVRKTRGRHGYEVV